MRNWHQHSAFVVVVVHGTHDISRTTWPDASEAKRYAERLVEQGVLPDNIRIYRTRLAKPPLPSF
ncbi:MAG: hypothetical protein AMJ38_03025 [Dehalococcoidia bacterium DG_22]|nr:MAG: hypothetical protein AMJ38_03025 [Dehalococcoidia bacterium DG_22]